MNWTYYFMWTNSLSYCVLLYFTYIRFKITLYYFYCNQMSSNWIQTQKFQFQIFMKISLFPQNLFFHGKRGTEKSHGDKETFFKLHWLLDLVANVFLHPKNVASSILNTKIYISNKNKTILNVFYVL